MIIQCPSCGARAKLPDSKEGAKVRCGECQRIYVAGLGRRGSSSASSSSNNQGLFIGLGVAALAAIVFLFVVNRGGSGDTTAEAREPAPERPVRTLDSDSGVDAYGYDSAPAKAARELHGLALARNGEGIRSRLHGPSIYAFEAEVAAAETARAAAEAEGLRLPEIEERVAAAIAALPPREERMAEFQNLPTLERTELLRGWTEELYEGEAKDLVADWKPYEGEIPEDGLTRDTARVQLRVVPVERGSVENRTVQWHMRRVDGRWLAGGWERFYTQAEKDAALRARIAAGSGSGEVEKVELSDGSVVYEREPEPLAHLDDTPVELRTKIDGLIATMMDLDLTREGMQAQRELVELGRPAIPALLTQLFETPLETEEQAIQLNLIVIALRDITGQRFGFRPSADDDSGLGTSEERRASAIKQWFAWWYRNEGRFTEKEVQEDLLDQMELTEEEQAYNERLGGGD